ncbi:uncharacterized protein LOC123544517 isoform X1 [Mercenaria mercenaria]|uniref:uncharacterized protein LOC123544517 isoform X1 n=1 Tax=Mercenaria mercenaria TaxID=6596 RepID=UPI00234E9862|nr:uncharacterized protein LOC123544517 isoform X1 [Mercenaria mercenaria]XP_053382055.1 uncharacterized protein LOC123544517 isoform X1 [Mercenaria mercenaria]XP_053382056.1 uncharacterized protein LOC123544517 isoform X1 [Mercenaria mercenaria]
MATPLYDPKLSGAKFKNWIKAGLGVLFTKEGIEPFVYDEIKQFQQKCLSDICNKNGLPAGTTCSSCCTENVVVCPTNRICNARRGICNFHRNSATQYLPSGCPNKICHNFKNEIKHAHRYYGPSYKNTDATQWCSNPWEVAKCFMPPDGYKDATKSEETDFNGTISVILNYGAFQSKIYDDLSNKNNIFEQGREVGKAVRHCPQLEMEDTDLQHCFSVLQNLLSDPAYLSANTDAHNAKTKLLQLQNDTLVICKDDVRKVLDDIGKAVQDEIRTAKEDYIKNAKRKTLQIIKLTKTYVSAIDRHGKASLSQLDTAYKSAMDEIEKQAKELIQDIQAEGEKQKEYISSEGHTVQRNLEDATDKEVKRLTREITAGINTIEAEATTQVKTIVSEGEKQKEYIATEGHAVKRQLVDVADQEVKRLKTEATAEINTMKTEANTQVKTIASEGEKQKEDIVAEGHTVKRQLVDVTDQEVKRLKTEATAGINTMKTEANTRVKTIASEAGKSIKQIAGARDEGVKGMRTEALTRMEHLKEYAEEGVNKLEVEAKAGVTKINLETDEALKQIEKSKAESKEDTYNKLKKELKDDLIDLYRERHHTLPMSPLMEENDTPLLKFYVMPDIESVEIQRARGGGKEIRSKVTSLHDVFYKEKEPCRKIYLAADAGFGKTALSKRLVLTWCQAKNCIPNEDEHFKKKDISTMSNFDFVFLLSLRDCSEEWDIDEMIKKQITNDLAHIISNSDFENILSKERCLIILDGLDEFTHAKSDIPHRKARRKCTILTTTRPWKLGVSKIRASEIERKLELIGLSKTSAKSLKRTVISLLCGKTDIEKHIQEFDRAISDRGISDLETIPLLLMYLLCLWCDGIELGASRTELYCQTIELLLKRTFEKYPDMQQSREQSQSDIPQCFSEHEHCKEHYTFLQALGQLAYETLFNEDKESTLVFSQSVTEKHLTSEYLKLSLDSGILTQSTEKTLTKQISKFSFSHKTIHEFFCALYISCQNENDVKNIVLNKCKSLQSILDMSTVLVFISGMVNTEIISSISQEFLSVISEDKITSEYRSTTDRYCKPLKDIQDMYISCMKENTSDKELKLFCQDFFFSEDCKEEKYFSYLARLAGHNKNNMASINIGTDDSGRSLREIIDCCELHELFQINKIVYCGEEETAQLPVLLDKSPKCVTVILPDLRGSWSREMLETLQNNSLLQAIHIDDFKMSHDVLNDFLNYIINRKTMTEIRLWSLDCTEHEWPRSCTFSLDFSQHSDLRKLVLVAIPEVSQLKVNSQVKHVELVGINLGEMSLPPEMANIESVVLFSVNMSASALRDLVKVVEKLSHKVTVTIWECEIEPETEFVHVIQYIHSSQNFRVIPDQPADDEDWMFVFETKVES